MYIYFKGNPLIIKIMSVEEFYLIKIPLNQLNLDIKLNYNIIEEWSFKLKTFIISNFQYKV